MRRSEERTACETGSLGPLRHLTRIIAVLLAVFFGEWPGNATDEVTLIRTPDGGIQPQLAVDDGGTLHLLYFKGEAAAGDLFYARRSAGDPQFRAPIRVNRTPRSAMAIGTIRGGQMAIGKAGRVHVAWNGVSPKGGDHLKAPMLYTRLNDAGTAFETERDVITRARGLDGGGSVAADGRGNVYVTWHAPKPGTTLGEPGRAVFVAHSDDGGQTFAPERLATEIPTGACGCCGMKVLADGRGGLLISYRGASETGNRDQILLGAWNGSLEFEIVLRHPWKIGSCPMSSASLGNTPNSVLAAWETDGHVYWSRFGIRGSQPSAPVSPPSMGRNPKHPVVVGNSQGEVLLVWTEQTGWAKGGDVAWQRFDSAGRGLGDKGHASGLPAWSLATAAATEDDRFIIIY
jgi:hypothetical protein